MEKRLWRTYFTPLNCMSIPCSAITILAIIFSYSSDDIPEFYLPSLIVWILGFLMFFIPSLIFSKSIKRDLLSIPRNNNIPDSSIEKSNRIYNTLLIIAFICIGFLFLKMRSISNAAFGGDEFSDQFVNGGFYGHITVLLSTVCAYMIYIVDNKHKLAWIIIILTLICMYARGAKSWIISPILIGFISRIIVGKTKFTWKIGVGIILSCVAIFVFSYVLILSIAGDADMDENLMQFLLNHFMFYLIGSPLSFSLDYERGILEPQMIDSLFAPIINIYLRFSQDSLVQVINPVSIDLGLGYANVRTFIGTIYAYTNSWYGLFIVTTIFSSAIYFIFCISRQTKNIFLILANSTNLSFLILGFFEFYWLNLGVYEMFVIFLIFAMFTHYPLKKPCNQVISA